VDPMVASNTNPQVQRHSLDPMVAPNTQRLPVNPTVVPPSMGPTVVPEGLTESLSSTFDQLVMPIVSQFQQAPNVQNNYAQLPVGWEMKRDRQNREYFVEHIKRITTYDDPRVKQYLLLPFPNGWEARMDQRGLQYFVDHINKRTTYEDP